MLFSGRATILAPANLAIVWTSPRITFLQVVDNVLFVNQHQTVQTEFFLARSRLIIPETLVANFVARFTHVTMTNLHKRYCGVFVEWLFDHALRWCLVDLFLGIQIFRILVHNQIIITNLGRASSSNWDNKRALFTTALKP